MTISRARLHAFHLRREHWVEGLGPGRLLDRDFDDDADDDILTARETIASGRALQLHPDARHHYPSPLHGPDGRSLNPMRPPLRPPRVGPSMDEVSAARRYLDSLDGDAVIAWIDRSLRPPDRHRARRPRVDKPPPSPPAKRWRNGIHDLAISEAIAWANHSLRTPSRRAPPPGITPPVIPRPDVQPLPDVFRWELIGGQYLLQHEAKVFWEAQWPPWCTWGVNWRAKHETMRA